METFRGPIREAQPIREVEPLRGKAAIVGVGAVTPVGATLYEAWPNIVNGKNGIKHLEFPDYPQIKVALAGSIDDFDPELRLRKTNIVTKSELRYLHRSHQLALAAVHEAGSMVVGRVNGQEEPLFVETIEMQGTRPVKRVKINEKLVDPEDVAVIAATGVGGSVDASIITHDRLNLRDPNNPERRFSANATDIFQGLPGREATTVSLAFGTKGGVYVVIAECASGNYAQGAALDRIRNKRSKVVIVLGAESCINPVGINQFEVNQTLSLEKDPNRAPRSFDKGNSGFVMGEGAAVKIYMDPDYAREKGIDIAAFASGYTDSGDAYSITFPDPEGRGVYRTMTGAIKDAGGLPKDGKIWNKAHATGTGADELEGVVIYKVEEDFMDRVAGTSSLKPMTGHLLGAAGMAEGAFCIMALQTGIIPPSIKSEEPVEAAIRAKLVRNEAITSDELSIVFNNGLGFGGTNATMMYEVGQRAVLVKHIQRYQEYLQSLKAA